EPTAGRIFIGGRDVTREDPDKLRQSIGYVIQSGGLFPHWSVRKNIGAIPRVLGWDKKRIAERTDYLLDLVGLDPATFADRLPKDMSGGQQQRVGVARALATDPPVLLMDEPFGAVDPEFRRHLQTEFARIQVETGTTVILVTHDIDEAARLGDRIAVLSRGGRLEQVASPLAVLAHPASDRVRDFIGEGSASRMLALAQVQANDLESADRIVQPAPAPVRLGARLTDAFEAVAALPGSAMGRVPVVGESGSIVGSLTADGILGALRRAADAAATDPGAADVQDATEDGTEDAVADAVGDEPGREPAV
ncbi:ABC transporter ATP-binding protein, partial [Promicromonospora sp. NPDC023987]|uniref:ABC transporter ATP-binding protein n=1 Tax=Promicromonospora sp. NPDC023987 TaxID=3155360 RepID=UPI003406521D